MAIDFFKAFDMVNYTKLISALILSPLSDNTKCRLSTYLKEHTASFLYNFTLSPSFYARVEIPQGFFISPALFNFFVFPHIPSTTSFLPTLMQMTSRIRITYWDVGG